MIVFGLRYLIAGSTAIPILTDVIKKLNLLVLLLILFVQAESAKFLSCISCPKIIFESINQTTCDHKKC